jgi:hypothetical protein
MPRKSTPPRCGRHTDEAGVVHPGCGAPIVWSWEGPSKRDAKWIAVEAEGMSDEDRLGKPRFDEAVHVQHRCREQPAAVAVGGMDPRVYLAGQALAVVDPHGDAIDLGCAEGDWDRAFARAAVRLADAVLRELEKPRGA